MKKKSNSLPLPPNGRGLGGRSLGYLFAALAAASYGTNPIFALPLYDDGMNVSSVLLLRYAIAVVMMTIMVMIKNPRALIIKGKDAGILAVMGVLMVASSITLFWSYNYLSAGIASTLLFFYPVMVALIMALLYGERLSRRKIACLILAFIGVATLSRGDDGTGISIIGFLLVMLSSLSYAIYLVYINRGRLSHIPPSAATYYVLVTGFFVLVANVALGEGMTLPQTSWKWIDVVGLGLFPTIISLWCTSLAIALVGSTQTAIFGALEPLTAVILGMIILGETITLLPAIGMVLIFVSVTLLMKSK